MYHLLLVWLDELLYIPMVYSSAFILTMCNIVSVLILRKIIYFGIDAFNNKLNSIEKISITDTRKYIIDFFCIASIFIVTIPSVLTNSAMYGYIVENGVILVTSPNMWHNPTQLMVRPFQLASLYFYLKVIQDIKSSTNIYKKNLAMFSLFSILATLAKPVGNFVMMPALAIYAAIVLFSDFKERIIGSLRLITVVLPIILVMYIQSLDVGTIGGDGGQTSLSLSFHFGTIANLSVMQVLSFAFSNILFALFIFASIGLKSISRHPVYCIGLLAYLVGFFQFFFITDGTMDFNTAWSYMFGSYIIMVCSIMPLITLGNQVKSVVIKIIGYCIYCLHFIFGLFYIILYINTGTFFH